MALKKPFEVSAGLIAQDAYIRVNNVSIVRGEKAGITVHVYTTDTAEHPPVWVRCYGFDYDLNGANAVAQAYEYLKTLPAFSDAMDC